MKNLIHLSIAIAMSILLAGCSKQSSEEIATRDNMHKLHSSLMDYWEENEKRWPESLEELVGDEVEELMTNPITGDNPGYRYTKPDLTDLSAEVEGGQSRAASVAVIEQLRNGEVDDSLRKLYADGSVR